MEDCRQERRKTWISREKTRSWSCSRPGIARRFLGTSPNQVATSSAATRRARAASSHAGLTPRGMEGKKLSVPRIFTKKGGNTMQLSRWCHLFHRDGVSALVNSLTLGSVYVPTEELHALMGKLRSLSDVSENELAQILISQGLLVESQAVDEQTFMEMRKRLKSEMSLELLYLLVTDGCNLRCTYCFEETPSLTGPFQTTQMTKETVTKALDLFATMAAQHGNPEKKKVIHLYGGEPLANRKAVYEAVSYANELKARGVLPNNCQIAIVTNGVLLNEEDARFFAKYNVTIGLSIDGPASITDLYRIPKRHGVRVTERVTNAFRLLKRYSVSVGLSVTLTPQAIEHFDEFLAFFTDGEFRTADGVSLNLLHFTPNMRLTDDY